VIDKQTFVQMYNAAKNYTDQLTEDNIKSLDYYLQSPRGDERPNESRAVSSDCFDVVESDMPSLIRTFLGGGDIMEFAPSNSSNKAEALEAEQKTKLINRLILRQEWSFKLWYDWLKGAGIFNYSAVTYYPKKTEKRTVRVYSGISRIELVAIAAALDVSADVTRVEVTESDYDDGTIDAQLEIWRKTTEYVAEYIQPDRFLISRGGPTLDDCSFVGHIDTLRKGELIEMGISRSIVKTLPSYVSSGFSSQTSSLSSSSRIDDTMQGAIGGGYDSESEPEWYLDQVEVVFACVMSASKSGHLDRRRVIYAGNEILSDEPFDHVNYAVLSAYPLPGQVIGMSRAGITRSTQDKKTFIQRGILTNMASVIKPMTAINISKDAGAVNVDDMQNRRPNGVVRVNGDPSLSIMPIPAVDVSQSALTLIQYLDFNRAQTTGALMASQGLNKDSIYNETATRFSGVQAEGAGKLETVMRIYAETGWRKVYRGFEWMVKHYQSDTIEENILGEQIAYSPSDWAYDCELNTTVGLAAADTSELIENLGAIYNTQSQLRAQGSLLVDDSKMFSTLSRLLKAMNVHDTEAFYNDPSQPDQTIRAQNEQMKALISQMQAQAQELQTNQAFKQIEELKAQVAMLKDQNKQALDAAKLQEDARQFDITTEQKERLHRADNAVKIAGLELEHDKNLAGGIKNER
jgi:hypothetical protein